MSEAVILLWLHATAREAYRRREIAYQLGYFGPRKNVYSDMTPMLAAELQRGRDDAKRGVEYRFTTGGQE